MGILAKISRAVKETCGGKNPAFKGIQWKNSPFRGNRNSAFGRRKTNATSMAESSDSEFANHTFYEGGGIKVFTNGNATQLIITIPPDVVRECMENGQSGESYYDLPSLFEDLRITGNTALDFIDPSETGDLTDAPMIGVRGEDYETVLARWAFMDYQITDPVEELASAGEIVLTGGPLN